jgi:hypothetical protein
LSYWIKRGGRQLVDAAAVGGPRASLGRASFAADQRVDVAQSGKLMKL